MIPKERQMIHRPDCQPGNRSPLCYCRKIKAARGAESEIWKDLGHPSREAYELWLKRISNRGGPLLKKIENGGEHN